MQPTTVIVLLSFLSLSLAEVEIVQDEIGNEYYLLPLNQRHKRDVPLYENDKHRVGGSVFGSGTNPTTLGGGVSYQHKPSGSEIGVNAANTRYHGMNLGTGVSANGRANLWRTDNGNSRLDAVGTYSRSFGGVGGTGRPNYYGGLQFSHRF